MAVKEFLTDQKQEAGHAEPAEGDDDLVERGDVAEYVLEFVDAEFMKHGNDLYQLSV